jgi:cyclase
MQQMKTTFGTSLLGQPARFAAGLEDLGGGLWAWLQPNGGLGESNAGLVVGDGESLLIDTLWDLRLTQRMLSAIAPHTATAPIKRLVNTHADGDHCWGNQLVSGVPITATEAAAMDMMREDPQRLRMFSRIGAGLKTLKQRDLMASLAQRLPESVARMAERFDPSAVPGSREMAGLGAFAWLLAAYDFEGISLTPPTETFTGTMEVEGAGRRLELIEVGPAHSPGDLVVHVPDERVVFAGDLVFVGVTPIMWVGPVENWIAGIDRIVELAPRLVVPGHGPVTGLDGVSEVRAYWELVAPAVRRRLADGLDPHAAARDVVRSREFSQSPFAAWDAPERIAINAAIIARNDSGQRGRVSDGARIRLLARMGELGAELQR